VAFDRDREFRRLGMVYAAEQSLQEMEADPQTKMAADAYTNGVNAYIRSLNKSSLPIEYKLLGTYPEQWTNLKSALFLKLMCYDLAGREQDFELTKARAFFPKEQFEQLFPEVQDSLDPVIPLETTFKDPKQRPEAPANVEETYLSFQQLISPTPVSEKPDPDNGSNNWAVSGSKTASGYPILCNDPHLGLNLPSIWYEMQISVPHYNVYGVSFPGTPGMMIGFNDHCAFGFTNIGRDVRDYFEITQKAPGSKTYLFNNQWIDGEQRIERYRVKGSPDQYDTVLYTRLGPVQYDHRFAGKQQRGGGKSYAVSWMAHQPSNELKFFMQLNRARDYMDYQLALRHLKTPGQNCLFACKDGDIAIRPQGLYPAKWTWQGDFVMPGQDSAYAWQGFIPNDEIPDQCNPDRGFVSSANQRTTGIEYPYYLGREYPLSRGLAVNRYLQSMTNIRVDDMKRMQTDTYSVFAEMAMPLFKSQIDLNQLTETEKKHFATLQSWDYRYESGSEGAVVFDLTWKRFYDTVFYDEYEKAPTETARPFRTALLEGVLRDTGFLFLDDIRTGQKERLSDNMTASFKRACQQLDSLQKINGTRWSSYNQLHIDHLLRLPAFSHASVETGGNPDAINAVKQQHGPSWRMIVHMTPEIEAYGIYPGGQNGNPGSPFFDADIKPWSQGQYHVLWMMRKHQTTDPRVRSKLHFSPIKPTS
ncbi:MAG: penicillin acylase family protein, partial [Ferruginibacter sp.]